MLLNQSRNDVGVSQAAGQCETTARCPAVIHPTIRHLSPFTRTLLYRVLINRIFYSHHLHVGFYANAKVLKTPSRALRHPRRRMVSGAWDFFSSCKPQHVKGRSAVSVSIKPLEDRIVVRPLEAAQTTASGLVIPDTAQERPQEGEVVSIGPGRVDDNGNRVPLDVSVGERVIYSKYGGTEVKYSGEELRILAASEILAIVEK